MKCSYYQRDVNQITLNHTIFWNLALPRFEIFVWIFLNVNLFLNQTLLTFLLYTGKAWMTHLILAIPLWRIIFLKFKRILLLKCMVLCEGRTSFCSGLISSKIWIFLLILSTGFTLFILLLLFFSVSLLHLYAHILMLFYLT